MEQRLNAEEFCIDKDFVFIVQWSVFFIAGYLLRLDFTMEQSPWVVFLRNFLYKLGEQDLQMD